MADLPHVRHGLTAWFSVSLLEWLGDRGCSAIGFRAAGDGQNADRNDESPFSVELPAAHGSASPGRLMFQGLRLQQGDEALLRTLLGASFQLRTWQPDAGSESSPADVCLVSRQAADQLLHDIRNRLNSLLMSAGVLYTAPPSVDLCKRFSSQIEADGKSCAEELSRLGDLFRTPPSGSDPVDGSQSMSR